MACGPSGRVLFLNIEGITLWYEDIMKFRFWCPLKLNSFCNFCIVCDYFCATKAELTACDTLWPKMLAYLWFRGQMQTSLCKGISKDCKKNKEICLSAWAIRCGCYMRITSSIEAKTEKSYSLSRVQKSPCVDRRDPTVWKDQGSEGSKHSTPEI